MNKQKPPVIFLGNGRCYHTMDWFRSAQRLSPSTPPVMITDLIDGESFQKLLVPGDSVRNLLILDRALFRKQTRAGNIWRNILKFSALPVQVLRLRKLMREYGGVVVHAHSMYYIVMARFASCRYVATPQGSELLVRPFRSKAYRLFARIGLFGASRITVDSISMRDSLFRLYGLEADIVQNGIDMDSILESQTPSGKREGIASIRGFSPNYRIDRLVAERNRSMPDQPIHFCYPFEEGAYKETVSAGLIARDRDLGRLSRRDLYALLLSSRLAVSIPISDSSPRSVYEAIFCGCIVAVTKGEWVSLLPACMAARLIVVDPESESWLSKALEHADVHTSKTYVPSDEALDQFDQKASMKRLFEKIYPAAEKN